MLIKKHMPLGGCGLDLPAGQAGDFNFFISI
jgi:hypothetical protein